MKAREVMTVAVVSVTPDTTTQETARILRDRGISAVPVVDEAGKPIGMLSVGDMIGRDDWVTLLAEGEQLNPDFLTSLRSPVTRAREVMTSPVIAVDDDADIRDIARMLIDHRIKRVPVLRDGRIVGIVSR